MRHKNTTQKQKILILEYYLIHKFNGLKSIAMDLDISFYALVKIVSEYEKTGFLILPSKMN
jgi:hypothetical protein